ncbi:hypothetical protein [Candidatus Palauibacter sp.]
MKPSHAAVLKTAFGATFADYCRNVPRWIPRARRDSRSGRSG